MKTNDHPLDVVIQAQAECKSLGIPSLCSAHPAVLEAGMRYAGATGTHVLIESTCNQVNQFGGYTGLTPNDFVAFVRSLADRMSFPWERVLLGGDHLGPNVWQNEPAQSAMEKAEAMVRAYITAGYTKIHLDASMKCVGDDPDHPLPKEVAARRAARLALAAENAYQKRADQPAPRYVIGTEVPVPGGALGNDEELKVTTVQDVAETIDTTQMAFARLGLAHAWDRVIAVVVQPGVEFGDQTLHPYQPVQAAGLARFIEDYPGLVYEAHSTDYQTREALRSLVADHFAILKVGPALTFAFREAVFALEMIEVQIPLQRMPGDYSSLRAVLEQAMLANPEHWTRYYKGDLAEQRYARQFSFSDRSRYYWPNPNVQAALKVLYQNLTACPPPLPLLSQFLPRQSAHVRSGMLSNTPHDLILDKIEEVLEDYAFACNPGLSR